MAPALNHFEALKSTAGVEKYLLNVAGASVELSMPDASMVRRKTSKYSTKDILPTRVCVLLYPENLDDRKYLVVRETNTDPELAKLKKTWFKAVGGMADFTGEDGRQDYSLRDAVRRELSQEGCFGTVHPIDWGTLIPAGATILDNMVLAFYTAQLECAGPDEGCTDEFKVLADKSFNKGDYICEVAYISGANIKEFRNSRASDKTEHVIAPDTSATIGDLPLMTDFHNLDFSKRDIAESLCKLSPMSPESVTRNRDLIIPPELRDKIAFHTGLSTDVAQAYLASCRQHISIDASDSPAYAKRILETSRFISEDSWLLDVIDGEPSNKEVELAVREFAKVHTIRNFERTLLDNLVLGQFRKRRSQ